ncbi:hypothetical protein [Microlunatus sp. GCM10028923]|uniref:hypothetical protein n=1 Tax=Microlunatus sp. GCM10028923 TaxID=3273400 RepID=UPI0036121F02
MNLELPPDRRLLDKQARIDRILDEPAIQERPARRRNRAWYALAAVVAVLAGAVALGLLARLSGPDVAGNPPPTAEPTVQASATPTPSPSRPTPGDPEELPVGGTAELEYFTFTVLDSKQTSAGFAVRIRTCLTGTPPNYESDAIPIGWYAWRAVTERNTYQANVEDLADPAFEPVYPSGTRYAVGDCATGWLPFEAIGPDEPVTELRYSNDYGGEARWRIG